ncbi:hypothetical protein H5407_23410 [Mitsuaria sp. WAJ17]|uniref:hypothetical protein n=1 Tax=Mitsuaria sp. WAJ17 TaxID=2761452 RepID=UPI001602BCD8|nr:hypothetical protein [Mitsuaria sp. WAJ17]MBB2488187.1 hypothetical protein [Mitsuaria sp. WAJ17]
MPVTILGLKLQAKQKLFGFDPYKYDISNDPQAMLNTFLNGNIEQQGQIFQDYLFILLQGGDYSRYQDVADHLKNTCTCVK